MMETAATDTQGSGSANAGFTLAELLVALALTAVIGATMAIAIPQLRPMRAFQDRMDEHRMAVVITDVIARDLQDAMRLPLIEPDGGNVLLRGGPRRITFTAIVPTGYMRRGLREVTYELTGTPGEARLRRTVRLRRFSPQDDAMTRSDEVLSGAFDMSLSYLVPTAPDQAEWRDDFTEGNSLPRAVMISLRFPGASRGRVERIVSYPQERDRSLPQF